MMQPAKKHWSGTNTQELKELLRFERSQGMGVKFVLFLVAFYLGSTILAGALVGYVRGYNRFMRHKNKMPTFGNLPAIVKWAMFLGGIASIVVQLALAFGGVMIYSLIFGHDETALIIAAINGIVNLLFSIVVVIFFRRWQIGMNNIIVEKDKFGSARFANAEELLPYSALSKRTDSDADTATGLSLGSYYRFGDKGHILTVAGTRGGKGTNLIIPNLLGVSDYRGSWVVIDPKGENAAITARYQRESGKNVVVLNPWNLHGDIIGASRGFNPLDILGDITSPHLVDDAQIIAEMIVPIDPSERDRFFSDSARSIVTGLLLHLVTSQPKEKQHLGTLWQWVRLNGEAWQNLVADMAVNSDPDQAAIINGAANEILKMTEAGDKTFGSIIATVLQCTDFLKSQALQDSLQSDFNPSELSGGNTSLYIIIPADKLQSHARWLRLIVTTSLRAVIRKPKNRVTFLLDEFAALGYLSEIETALSTYAGYNVMVWPILQSLVQLQKFYKDNWEIFIANTAVCQFFSIRDSFTAKYFSEMMGKTTTVIYEKGTFSTGDVQATPRPLITPDELMRMSGRHIFASIAAIPPVFFEKIPYYEIPYLLERADNNPYVG
jgi:type IV secretion system protein VirD4